MTGYNIETLALVQGRPLKHHELRTIELIAQDWPTFAGRLLDVGCADGRLLQAISDRFPGAALAGIDASEELIDRGRRALPDGRLDVGDAADFQPREKFDVIIAAGLISIFDDPLVVLRRMVDWLETRGLLLVFGRFTTMDMDVRIHFRRSGQDRWQGGLTAFSLKTVGAALTALDLRFSWERFRLPIPLPRTDDPIRTYTVETRDGETLVLNGANIVAEHYFLLIRKS